MSKTKITVNPIFSLPLLPILIILKLTEVIDLSWWWVFGIPILIPLGIVILFFIGIMICLFIGEVLK